MCVNNKELAECLTKEIIEICLLNPTTDERKKATHKVNKLLIKIDSLKGELIYE